MRAPYRCKLMTKRKRLAVTLLCFSVFLWIVALLHHIELRDIPHQLRHRSVLDAGFRSIDKCPANATCIALATEAFGGSKYWQYSLQPDKIPSCAAECPLVSNPEQARGLLFHAFDLPSRRLLRHMRSSMPRHQLWIFYSMESPVHLAFNRCVRDCNFALPLIGSAFAFAKEFVFPSYLLRHYPDTTEEAGFFNWTATYRRDSTVYWPYARYGRLRNDSGSDWRAQPPPAVSISQKKHLSFIAVSNCHPHNRRQEMLNDLRKHMEIHIYGHCGDRRVPEGTSITELSKSYYFHLSFENAFCQDYITEKFFVNGLGGHAVPVVFGGFSRADYEAVAPPKSFLYAGDFASAKDLAQKLRNLAANPQEYVKYHEWRSSYGMIDAATSRRYNLYCQLCRKLRQASTGGLQAEPLDLNKFYSSGTQCRTADFVPYGMSRAQVGTTTE